MFNPIEMFPGQGGAGMQAMAQQFGLSPEQTARALEALMPALTLGLQRGAGLDPAGFARMFGMPDLARSAAPQGLDALGQMFGSAQLMQAVLQQASASSGVGSQVLRQMLPMIAGAVVASIVHVLLNPPEPAQAKAAAPQPFPFGPVWADMAKVFMPAAPPPAKVAASPAPAPAKPPRTASPDRASGAPGPDMFQQMFRSGAEMQGQNMRAMQGLFETFWPTPARKAEGGPTAPEPAPWDPAPAEAPAAPPGPVPAPPPPKPRRGRRTED